MVQINSQKNTSIVLKKAGINDIPVLLEIEKSVAGTKIYSPTLEVDEWKEELHKAKVLLIKKNNTIIGNLTYEQKGNDCVYISGLVIKPDFQGQGIARKVLTNLLKKLQCVRRIYLVTHPNNLRALNLYRSLGFVVESKKENYYGDGEPRMVLAFQQ